MKSKILMMVAVFATATSVYAQDIVLPSPQMSGGLPINRTLAERHSEREFNQQLLSLPDTSLPVMNNPVGYQK